MTTEANSTQEPGPEALEPRLEAMIRAVEKIQALTDLSSTAKAVMIRLTLRYPGRAVRGECPGPAELSPWLGLSERSIRRAYAELEYAGYIAEVEGPDGELQSPHGEAALQDGWPYLREDTPMDMLEHVAHLEWLRDLAVARGRIGVAVNAEKSAGRALGFYGEGRGRKRPYMKPARSGRDDAPAAETGGTELAKTGAELAQTGSALAFSGSNWHELAETGMVHRTPEGPGFFNRYKALMGDLPA